MTVTDRSRNILRLVSLWLAATAVVCALLALVTAIAATAQAARQRTFRTPDDAVHALIDAARTSNLDELLLIFGPDGKELIASSEPATARRNREVFTVAVNEKWHLVDEASAREKTLVIGNEDWPFPVPIVSDGSVWRFDTAAGKEEVLARRIGQNELAAIETCRAYVTAQERYAQQGHDGKPAGLFATKFRSDPGKENGLYWPTAHGKSRSPLGDLVADAAVGGTVIGTTPPSPLHGYYFRIVTAQGAAATGGVRNYLRNGDLSDGFALVAWPAQYNVTGVMSFVVNRDGVVHERDLGTGTDAAAKKITSYNPDSTWRVVE